jgi:hypothetical protein
MCTKFYFNNLVSGSVLNPSTENAQFPAENILDSRRTKVFRSNTNSDHVYFDFGAAEPIDSFVAVGHIIDGFGFVSASVELNNVATWTTGAIATIAVTIDNVNGIAHGELVSPVNARYAKLIMTSTLGYCEVSKVFIGVKEEVGTDNDFTFPLTFQMDNRASVQKNRYGQRFVDEITTSKKFRGDLKTMTNDEVDMVYDLANQNSFTKPFFMRIEDAEVFNDNDRVNGYYYLTEDPSFSYDNGGFWSTSLSLEEGM